MESASIVEHVSISIDEKLARHSGLPRERCIFKVHEKLRKLNPDAYEPAILAIGPYHRGKINLQGMEEVKLQYLKSLLVRKEETSAERYVLAMRELEEKARKCYAEPVGLTSDEFVDMMLLDGCFIIELFLKLTDVAIDENDRIFGTCWMGYFLLLDLILFENQLPFFVLLKLYALIEGTKPEEFVYIALNFFAFSNQNLGKPRILDMSSIQEVQHLLDLLHRSRCPDPFVRTEKRKGIKWGRIQCASQLEKAGIKFKKTEDSNLFDITYSNGTLKIPNLTIEEKTEPFFRNLIAHEQYGDSTNLHYITHYCFLMDYLIDDQEDVSLLQRDEIITNCLGGDEVVCNMFNKLCHNLIINDDLFSYNNILDDVRTHCRKRRNIWMATLRRDYFNSPWALISFLAAFVLLVLTITQTVFAAP
ncbi:UPF0481 protein At3g47200-like [Cornus florida]|uniref:UPF0481 protein At3g47200-like n=1 Tax=Cornus florida TaxID=4283 RepID=UPI00289CE56C|nr:UPF0481 protein At3g47200-like [Cornus florida]XP_059651962.1 UPF0481 protein At3g47200-like [Cornus florida]XP_059651973.1 UPF0481 protein At3g47200-like [Cornus florida]XP_059651981.1 UPF0481 protein At3g47200-like [Cornus florida]XP_059651990.1 UPF0481 protein At3g47200-like [Cornus florida]XP_059651999.1 UPF0481 protein At3g47200-like [Cornus florida]XP_059652008.1 UPF0481 protein At3g47200-like [Cornus florida]